MAAADNTPNPPAPPALDLMRFVVAIESLLASKQSEGRLWGELRRLDALGRSIGAAPLPIAWPPGLTAAA